MAENMIKFLRGSVANLPASATAGAVYFTKDEGLYLGLEDGSYHRYGDFITVANVAALPEAGAHETCMYYCESENILAKWNGTEWVQINKQKTLAELGGVAKSVYEAKIALLEKADSDNATAISGVDGRLQTVETAIGTEGSVTKAIAAAQSQADKGVADAAAALAKANEKTTMAEVEAKNYATKTEAQGYADAKDEAIAAAHKAGTDAATAAGVADGKAVAAQGAADKAQGDVDALKGYVGTIPEGATATDIVGYVQEKTSGIASEGAMTELGNRVGVVEGKVATIEGDYLKAADKTELQGKIDTEKGRIDAIEAEIGEMPADASEGTTVWGAIDTVTQAVDACDEAIGGIDGRVEAIEKDYLKAADKTELSNAIAAEKTRAEEAEAGLQTQINTIMNNPDAEGAINSINEFTQYVKDHGTIADGFRADIDKNKDDIAAMDEAYKAADTAIKGRLDVLEAIDHEAYIAADTALKNELNGEIAKKADSSALTAAVEALEGDIADLQGVDAGFETRIAAVEAKFTGDSSVADQIAEAKQAAIDAAAADAATKDAVVLSEAQKYADAEDAKIEARVDALETASATHALKSEVEAVAGRMTTAEGEIDTLQSEMDAVEAKAAANETAIGGLQTAVAGKAAQADLEGAVARIDALEDIDHEAYKAYADQAEADALAAAKTYVEQMLTWGEF